MFNPLAVFCPSPLTSGILCSKGLCACCSPHARSLLAEPLGVLHMEQKIPWEGGQGALKEGAGHSKLHHRHGQNSTSPLHALLFSPHYKTWKPKAKNCLICHVIFGYIPPQNAHLYTWGWPEQFPNPGRVPAASMLLLSQLQAGERLWEQGQQGILHPLRSSPRALWGSGFKAGQSLHLMWNREPAGIVSHSLHLFPHAPKPVYPAWL